MASPDTSRASVLRVLKIRGRASVDEVADAAALSKNAARVQLLKLEADGVAHRLSPVRRGAGRPPLAFALTAAGHRLFPDDDGRMLTELLAFLDAAGAGELTQAFFEQLWAKRRAELDAQLAAGATLTQRLRALRALLDAGDFMPQIRQRRGRDGTRTVRIRACHCPYPGAVAATRLPCQLEREFLADVVGARPTSVRLATVDEPGCVFDFEL